MLAGYTKCINDRGGVITWDVPPTENALIPEEFFQLLLALKSPSKPTQ